MHTAAVSAQHDQNLALSPERLANSMKRASDVLLGSAVCHALLSCNHSNTV